MTDDSAVVQYNDDVEPGAPGPAVELDYYESPEGGTQWNDPDATWVLDIGKDADSPQQVIAEVNREWDSLKEKLVSSHFDEQQLLQGVEKVYSTSKAAEFFGRSTQWIYWGLRPDHTGSPPFIYKDGTPILPERVGPMGKRRFTLPIIREIALACFRRGNLTEDELEAVMARILLAEFGRRAFAD